MLIIGEKEAESGTMSVRRQGAGDVGTMDLDAFLAYSKKSLKNKKY